MGGSRIEQKRMEVGVLLVSHDIEAVSREGRAVLGDWNSWMGVVGIVSIPAH